MKKSAIYLTLIYLISNTAISSSEFVFVAEIPTYCPFKETKEDILFDLEKPLASNINFHETKYSIHNGKWRGKLSTYDKTPRSERAHILNIESDQNRLKKLAQLFQKEAFGSCDEESKHQFDCSMRLVLLANRMKSILAVKNKSIKHISNQEIDPSGKALIIKGLWEPKWVKRGKVVSLKEVRQYLRYCIKKAKDTSISDQDRLKWKQKAHDLLEEEKKGSDHVPYHELREILRINDQRNRFVSNFIATKPTARLYEATHDSDLVGLRIASDKTTPTSTPAPLGLYSHYLNLLKSKAPLDYPQVLTTGYRTVYEADRFESENYFAWVYQAIEDDRYARAAASTVDFRVGYIAEPNCLYLVPQGHYAIPYTFLELPNKETIKLGTLNKYDPCESLAIMRQIYSMNPSAMALFDPTHPVLMIAPGRMLLNKTSETQFNLEKYGNYDLTLEQWSLVSWRESLNFAAQISQTPFSYRNYAMTLYRSLGLTRGDGKNLDLFKSLIPTIFNFFDLKNADVINGKLEYPSQFIFHYTDKKREDDPEKGNLVMQINEIIKMDSAEKQEKALISLFNNIYGNFVNNIGNILFKTAKAMGISRREHYMSFFMNDSQHSQLRTSPTKAIEQSPKKSPLTTSPVISLLEMNEASTGGIMGQFDRGVSEHKASTQAHIPRSLKIEFDATKPLSAEEKLEQFFQQAYERSLVTTLLGVFDYYGFQTQFSEKTGIDTRIIANLKNSTTYKPHGNKAQLVWNFFHNKTMSQITAALEMTPTQLTKLKAM
jgi:hypothetical protein